MQNGLQITSAITGSANPENIIFNSQISSATEAQALALLALDHTKLEHQLYEIMLYETKFSNTKIGDFSIRYLMKKSKVSSYSRVSRARQGLLTKLSIEAQTLVNESRPAIIYTIYRPQEILERRSTAINSSPEKKRGDELADANLLKVIEKIMEKTSLSRREAQVSLHCAQGKTNAEIGAKLFIHKETVKFHLHNIFIKFGIRRRTELVAHLYRN